MMLFKLSFKNIKKGFREYAIYFFTLIVGVSIFYTFNSIESQSVMLDISKSTHDAMNMISSALSAVSIFVSFVLGFLIIYANGFLMKRRNKEFAVYMTLGMSKGKISKILLFETLLIGGISLIVGLIMGVALSQVMSIVVVNMFDADMSKFEFIFSATALSKTILYFGIMYLLVMIFNTFQVSRCKLIDLIQGSKKTEEIKIKNPYICILLFLCGVALLSYAYYNVTLGAINLETPTSVMLQILYGAIGTVLIFWSISGLVIRVVMCKGSFYYNNLNSFSLRQISSRINTTIISMSIICLMLFLTITIFTSAITLNGDIKNNLQKLVPADITIENSANLYDEDYFVSRDKGKDVLEKNNFNIDENLKDIVELNNYATKDLTLKDTLGINLDDILEEDYPFYNVPQTIVKVSDYNKVAKLYNNEVYTLKDNEYMIISDYKNMVEIRNEGLKNKTEITLLGKTYYPKYTECKDGFITISYEHNNMGIILVPDGAVNESIFNGNTFVANYKGESKAEKQAIQDKVIKIRDYTNKDGSNIIFNTKIEICDYNIGTSAMAVFIGLYLGIIFLISSAAILALKELSENADNRERYIILRKIGVDEKMINRSLLVQSGIFFTLPLILASIHSIFGIQVGKQMLEGSGEFNILPSVVATVVFLIVIYGGYFIITYLCSKKIISEN